MKNALQSASDSQPTPARGNEASAAARHSEEKSWNPSRWKAGKVNRFLLNVYKQASWASCDILGPHDGMIIAAQLRSERAASKSRDALQKLGVKTIG